MRTPKDHHEVQQWRAPKGRADNHLERTVSPDYLQTYKQLQGSTIERVNLEDDECGGPHCKPVLQCRLKNANGTLVRVEVWQDDEGNGPGALAITGAWDPDQRPTITHPHDDVARYVINLEGVAQLRELIAASRDLVAECGEHGTFKGSHVGRLLDALKPYDEVEV